MDMADLGRIVGFCKKKFTGKRVGQEMRDDER